MSSNTETTVERAINFLKIVNDVALCQDCANKIKESLELRSAGGGPTPSQQQTQTQDHSSE